MNNIKFSHTEHNYEYDIEPKDDGYLYRIGVINE
jgi:hypothetical protein